MSKSYVTMESKLCITCGNEYSTGNILMDKRLRDQFDRDTITGWGLCDTHLQAFRDGWVALIEIDAAKSAQPVNGIISNEGAYRTGTVVLVRRDALNTVYDTPVPEKLPAVYIGQDAFKKLLPKEVLDNAPEESARSTAGDVTPGPTSIN